MRQIRGAAVVLSVSIATILTVVVAWGAAVVYGAGPSRGAADLQKLYEAKEYQRTLDEIMKLDPRHSGTPEIRRLKTRALIRLGRPKEALTEYDQLAAQVQQDELPVLREVAMGFIVVMMKDMREQMRGAAYTALKEVDSEETVALFEDGLSDGSGPVRVLAVEGLGRSAAGRRSPKLRTALDDQAGLVKARVVKVLGRSGDAGVVPLIDAATKDELNTVRIAAYGSLIRLGRKEAWEQLRQAAEAPNPEDRAEALRVMAELKDERGTPLMKEHLTNKQPSVRGAAARGLGHLGRKELRTNVEALLRDPVPAVRESAASSLADMNAQESVPALTQALQDGAFTVRAAVAAALLQLGQPFDTVGPTLRSLTQQNDTGARASAAQALGKATKANSGGAVSLLGSLLADPLPSPKIVAVRSLGHIGDRSVLPALIDSLHDENDAVRATAGGAILHILTAKK